MSNFGQAYQNDLVPALMLPGARMLLEQAHLQPGERLLDVATGTGVIAREAAPLLGAHGSIDALDMTPMMLDVARALPAPNGAPIRWIEGNAMALPFEAGSYHVVICQQGFQFFPDQPAAAREMRRVLAPNGRVLLSVSGSLADNTVYRALNDSMRRITGIEALAAPFWRFGLEGLKERLSAGGFSHTEVFPVTLNVRFPDAARFLYISVFASAAVVQELNRMDDAARYALVDALQHDMGTAISDHVKDGVLTFPWVVYVGRASG